MSQEILTAVLCAYNPPLVWRQVVATLQQGPFQEILIVDDGSSIPLAHDFSDDRIRFIRLPRNQGLAHARNTALNEVKTPWVFFIDSDVVPFPHALKRLPSWIQQKEVDGIGFHVQEYNRSSPWDFYRAVEREQVMSNPHPEWLSGLCCAYSTQVLREVNGFDPQFRTNGEDVDLGYRLTQKGKKMALAPELGGMHWRQDSFCSFLKMNYRYALTGKRVKRSFYFPAETSMPPVRLWEWASASADLRIALRFLEEKPFHAYLPFLVMAAKVMGSVKAWRSFRKRKLATPDNSATLKESS